MTPDEFAELVRRMRDAQRRYYKTRDPAVLIEAKQLERAVDQALTALRAPAPTPTP